MEYPWPGNVRELEHALEHAFILCKHSTITLDHLPFELKNFTVREIPVYNNGEIDDPQIILQALEKTDWNKSKAAQLLGISRRSIYRKIKEHKIIQS
jgi:transcriptional regulator of acetoin/glycerol metabolism